MQILSAEYCKVDGDTGDYCIRERLQPESGMEVEVLRQAILADKRDLPPEQLKLIAPHSTTFAARLCASGGQGVFHPDFHRHVVWFYQVGESGKDGFFELNVTLVEKDGSKVRGSFRLFACLVLLRRPPFQTGWAGSGREFFVCPWWYYFSKKAEPSGVLFQKSVRNFDNGPLFVSSLGDARAEWDCPPPHFHLIAASSIAVNPTSTGETTGASSDSAAPRLPVEAAKVSPAPHLAAMLDKPQFLADPVFPKENYLQSFGMGFFRKFLADQNQQPLIEHVRVVNADSQMAMLMTASLGFWAIDLEVKSGHGNLGRDEFVSRVALPIRRPPPGFPGMEQHILASGVVTIQIEEEPPHTKEYQICQKRTVGWYVAGLKSPP